MIEAKALYEAGELQPAIEALTREVKANPNDTARRTFLFELLCFAGEWERAEKQLDVISHQSTGAELGAQVYRNVIKAERARRRLLAEGLQPHFLAEPPAYVDWHMEAINHLRNNDAPAARETLDRAEAERPALAGMLNGRPFHDFRDYHDLFAPVLELIVQDKYTWLPFEQVKRMEITAPRELRDLVWATADIETTDKELRAFVPALYVNSGEHVDDRVRMGRMTDWQQIGEELYLGAGQRLFAVDGEEKAMLEVRSLVFDARDSQAAPAASTTTTIH